MKATSKLFSILMFLWKINPLKKSSARLIKKLGLPINKLYADMRFKGVMNVEVMGKVFKLYNPGFTTIENEIFWKGLNNGWEKVSIELWQQLVIDSNNILDIGANTGIYSFVAGAVNPSATIYSFEPVKRTSTIFKQNLMLNPKFNIHFIEKAVSNKNGKAVFYDIKSESQYSASLNLEMLKSIKNRVSYEVDIVSLDLLTEINDKKIDLIKLDVEMHEPEVIEGMINILKKINPQYSWKY